MYLGFPLPSNANISAVQYPLLAPISRTRTDVLLEFFTARHIRLVQFDSGQALNSGFLLNAVFQSLASLALSESEHDSAVKWLFVR
mmetsp:Transcript_41459/g.98235  ORF Transcript_41459/g.98235 Transcript_41459/m.98235 type:complete len:86 (+) Transcript_41459:1118-1375(+)